MKQRYPVYFAGTAISALAMAIGAMSFQPWVFAIAFMSFIGWGLCSMESVIKEDSYHGS